MSVDMSITLNKKDVRIINQFIKKFPNVVDKATGKTAERGTAFIVKKTPRSPVGGGTRRAWAFKRLKQFVWIIFNPLKHVVYLEEGTGIHGSKNRLIRPRTAKVLRWVDPQTGNVIFRAFVRGIRALHIVETSIPIITKMLIQEIKKRVAKEWSRRN